MFSDSASLSSRVAFMVLMCVKLVGIDLFWFGVPFTCNIEKKERFRSDFVGDTVTT